MTLEVKLQLVPGSANRQWEAVVTLGGNRDVFRGPLAAVIAALHVTLDELAGSRRPT